MIHMASKQNFGFCDDISENEMVFATCNYLQKAQEGTS